jgi:hypothetical protein
MGHRVVKIEVTRYAVDGITACPDVALDNDGVTFADPHTDLGVVG